MMALTKGQMNDILERLLPPYLQRLYMYLLTEDAIIVRVSKERNKYVVGLAYKSDQPWDVEDYWFVHLGEING